MKAVMFGLGALMVACAITAWCCVYAGDDSGDV